MSKRKIFEEVTAERKHQDEKWGGKSHDDNLNLADWQKYISEYLYGSSKRSAKHNMRTKLVKVAALAFAAIESLDRKAGAK